MGEHNCVTVDGDRKFTFDHVFSQTAKQTDLYENALHPWMTSFLQGFNVTVIAYGQTGSGKTFTMGNAMPAMANQLFSPTPSTDSSGDEKDAKDVLGEDEGLIPRFLHHLFAKLDENKRETKISVSFLEIYGEDIHDLLESADSRPNRRMEPLQLRENRKHGVWVQGLTEVAVTNRQEAMEQMRRGSLQRITASTQMNERSSRSHAVYTVKIIQRLSQEDAKESSGRSNNQRGGRSKGDLGADSVDTDAVIVSKLTFVDLAGSERLKKTLAEGERMKEGIQINVGLFALGNVINALGDEKRRATSHGHVPYRSSKLTRLLQDALGGNSRTLFIACVSPAESNSNETLNTLQYANRAKNIQNKAVKNVDSRTAELVSLKAFNQLLCRELVKSIFTRLGEMGPAEVDNLAGTTLTNPKVLAYLNKIEQVATSTGLESSTGERSIETRRLLNGLTAQLYEMAPSNEFRRATSLSSLNGDEDNSIEPQDGFLDLVSDSESSVALLEEPKPDTLRPLSSPYSLRTLSRTLEIVNLSYEIQELLHLQTRQQAVYHSKNERLKTQLHRKELLRDGLADMIANMETWLSLPKYCNPGSHNFKEVQRFIEQANEKLEIMEIEMADFERQKTALKDQLHRELEFYRTEMKAKQGQIEQLRQLKDDTADEADASTLSVVMRKAEIGVRFGELDLEKISQYLSDDEREIATYIAECDETISYMSPLFTADEQLSIYAREVVYLIQDQVQIDLDKEDLQASMAGELRNRSQLFHDISNGLMACHHGDMTEQEFMEKNERDLSECQERIRQIRDAVRVKEAQQTSMRSILDSITSLDAAKALIRTLIVELYAQKRIYMVMAKEEETRESKQQKELREAELSAKTKEMEERVGHLEAKYAKDIQSAFEMVTSLNNAVERGEIDHSQNPVVTQMEVSAISKVAELETREKQLTTELESKDEQIVTMRAELDRLQQTARNAEMQEESFRLMNKCQEIWKELGMDEDYQMSKFQDINELLLKKCSEELEGLESARQKLQSRIDTAYSAVSQLESILQVPNPLDVGSLSTTAGNALLEQEKYLLTARRRLEKELLSRVKARIRLSDDIGELVGALQITASDDFLHVAQDELGNVEGLLERALAVDLVPLRAYQQDLESSHALESMLETSGDDVAASVSKEHMEQDKYLFTVLLKEKAKRITELEKSLSSVRAVARTMQLSHEQISEVLESLRSSEGREDTGLRMDRIDELKALILQKGGQLDVSNEGLKLLATALRSFEEIQAGRLNALEFLHQTLEEASMILNDSAAAGNAEDESSTMLQQLEASVSLVKSDWNGLENACLRDTLAAGKRDIERLSEPVEMLLKRLFYSMNEEFAAFGIDTNDQRVSFFLGCNDEGQQTRRRILERYAVFASSSDEEDGETSNESLPDRHDSFLSRLDPEFEEFYRTYSLSFGEAQLQRLRDIISDMAEVKRTVRSAQNRLQSLQKIMKLFNQINEFKTKIAEFEANASKKDRLFGSSLRLLEEERFRKMAAKRYPNLLAALRKEVTRWLDNEDGEYDLTVLGEDLKNLLLDMMNTDTGLMHLDLGVVDPSRGLVRRPSKLAPTASSSAPTSSARRSSSPGRARTQSGTPRARSSLHSRTPSLNHE